jgi:protein SCO1
LLVALALAACSGGGKPAFKNTDITGATYARGFELVDPDGAKRTLAEFKGRVTTVFFGFTHCPDVCPTTLAEMKAVIAALGPAGKDVQVLFVTVDPERDTAELLKNYVTAFDPSFIGLRGSPEQIAAVAKEFKVFYQKSPSKTNPGQYTVDHTAGTYVFDRQGRIRLFVRHAQGVETLASDLKILLTER